jgi:hypothetical protein
MATGAGAIGASMATGGGAGTETSGASGEKAMESTSWASGEGPSLPERGTGLGGGAIEACPKQRFIVFEGEGTLWHKLQVAQFKEDADCMTRGKQTARLELGC